MTAINKNPILVTSYVNPDLDGYSSTFAYTEFLKNKGRFVFAGVMGEPHEEVKYVIERFKIDGLKSIKNDQAFKEVILVDASDSKGLKGNISPAKVIEIIDHRKVNEAGQFKQAKVQIELVGAAATLVAEKFQQENVVPSKQSAIVLYSAIISNTLNFQATVTTARDRQMASWLRQFIKVADGYSKDLFFAKSDLAGDKLAVRIAGDSAWFELGNKKIGISQLEIIGAKGLLNNRSQEIVSILNKIKTDLGLDLIFQNTIDLEVGVSYFITEDQPTQAILEKSLGVKFNGVVATANELIMRKQIVPLIKEELER